MILANLLSGSDSRFRAPMMNRTTRREMTEWAYVIVGKKSLSEGEDTQQTGKKGESFRKGYPCSQIGNDVYLETTGEFLSSC